MINLREILHVTTVFGLFGFIIITLCAVRFIESDSKLDLDKFPTYNTVITAILYFVRVCPLLCIFPVAICNFAGLLYINTQHEKPKIRCSTLFAPFVCFRIVVGDRTFPEHVQRITQRNIDTCINMGLRNFVFDLVIERPLGTATSMYLREIVVPESYQTENKSVNKARALQYCLEDGVNIFTEDDWIVHLNEGTLITEDSVVGITNFIYDTQFTIGQGLITCENKDDVNVISILGDSSGVALDYGMMRFALRVLHRPLFGIKSSFLIVNAKVERTIGFDFGITSDTAIENVMALSAWKRGYKFDFIDGEMQEQATSSHMQLHFQRKHCVIEVFHVLFHSTVPFIYTIGIALALMYSMVLQFAISYFVLGFLYPLPWMLPFCMMYGFIFGTKLFQIVFGTLKTHKIGGLEIRYRLKLALISLIVSPCVLVTETTSIYMSLLSRRNKHSGHSSFWEDYVV